MLNSIFYFKLLIFSQIECSLNVLKRFLVNINKKFCSNVYGIIIFSTRHITYTTKQINLLENRVTFLKCTPKHTTFLTNISTIIYIILNNNKPRIKLYKMMFRESRTPKAIHNLMSMFNTLRIVKTF